MCCQTSECDRTVGFKAVTLGIWAYYPDGTEVKWDEDAREWKPVKEMRTDGQ